jgi:phosphodiesterase/alkaline phosphatase D-like protein
MNQKFIRRLLSISVVFLLLLISLPLSTIQVNAATPPSVTTGTGTSSNDVSATVTGNLTSLGSATSVNVCFLYGISTSYGSTTPLQTMTAAGAFTYTITGLLPSTTYNFCANADGGPDGTATGLNATFTTPAASPPQVSTTPASGITTTGATVGGFLSSLGFAITVNVYIEYGTTTSYGTTTAATPASLTAAGAFTASLTGLQANTTYHFTAYADGGTFGTATGTDMTFTTTSNGIIPTVNTDAAQNVSYYSATLEGNLISLGNASSVNVFFKYGTTTSYGITTTAVATSALGSFSANISGLKPNTTYHFITYADGGTSGIGTGTDMTFITPSTSAPEVSTTPASSVTTGNATVGGYLDSLGSATSVNVYIEYGTTTSYGTTTAATPATLTTPGSFILTLSGLQANTTYHFIAYADGGTFGTATGNDMTFTTSNNTSIPEVNTNAAQSVSYYSATLEGNLIQVGSNSPVSVYFNYGTTTNYGTTIAASTPSMTATGAFSVNLTGLQPNTTYHFIAYAQDHASVVAYGTDMTFTTPSTSTPQVNTTTASGISTTGATVGGFLTSLGSATSVNVYIEYGTTTSYGTTTAATPATMTATGTFTLTLSGLQANTTYHFIAYADGGTFGTATGNDMTFTTSNNTSIPEVNTNAAQSVSYYSATLEGNLIQVGSNSPVSVYFNYGTTTNYGTTIAASTPSMTATGAFSVNLTGLQPNTTYHFIAYAQDHASVVAYGTDMTFTTPSTSTPQVNTTTASGISTTGATVGGFLTSLGSATSVNVYIEYGTTTSYGTTTAATPATMTATGTFTLTLSGLQANTTYHFIAYADGGTFGTATGNDMTFTTSNNTSIPEVNTNAAQSVSYYSATLEGNLIQVGSNSPVSVYFNYGTTTNYGTTIAASTPSMTATGAFSVNLTGLQPNTTYHFIAYAQDHASVVAYGTDMTFTTPSTSTPQVNTTTASGISTTGATVGGFLTSLGSATSVNVYIEYGTTTSYGTTTAATPATMTATGTFTLTLSGLQANTTYHFIAYADGGTFGTATGNDMTFTTSNNTSIPEVNTNAAQSVSYYSATLEGNLIQVGSNSPVSVYFNYGTTTNYGTTIAASTPSMTATGAFSVNLTGLQPNTTYHFIAYAQDHASVVAYGTDMTFTTPSTSTPQVNTTTASGISTTGATVGGFLTSLGSATSVNVYIEYGTTTSYGTTTAATPATMTATGTFTLTLSGLQANTTYHFIAYADGGTFGTATGNDMTFIAHR